MISDAAPVGKPYHRGQNPHCDYQLPALPSATGDGRRPTQFVHFITPNSLQPRISHEMEFCVATGSPFR